MHFELMIMDYRKTEWIVGKKVVGLFAEVLKDRRKEMSKEIKEMER